MLTKKNNRIQHGMRLKVNIEGQGIDASKFKVLTQTPDGTKIHKYCTQDCLFFVLFVCFVLFVFTIFKEGPKRKYHLH